VVEAALETLGFYPRGREEALDLGGEFWRALGGVGNLVELGREAVEAGSQCEYVLHGENGERLTRR